MRTTLDPRLQTAARVALMNGLEDYDRRHGWRGAWGKVSDIAPGWEAAALKKTPPAERRAWRAAVVDRIIGNTIHVIPAKDYDRRRPGLRGRRLGQTRQGAQRRRPDLRRAGGRGRRLPAAPGPGRQRRAGRHRALHRPRSGDGRRLFLLAVEVQPRHPGRASARIGLQAVRLRHRPVERLYAGQLRHRRAHHACRAPAARPGRRRTTTANIMARCRCAGVWSCRATP